MAKPRSNENDQESKDKNLEEAGLDNEGRPLDREEAKRPPEPIPPPPD